MQVVQEPELLWGVAAPPYFQAWRAKPLNWLAEPRMALSITQELRVLQKVVLCLPRNTIASKRPPNSSYQLKSANRKICMLL